MKKIVVSIVFVFLASLTFGKDNDSDFDFYMREGVRQFYVGDIMAWDIWDKDDDTDPGSFICYRNMRVMTLYDIEEKKKKNIL